MKYISAPWRAEYVKSVYKMKGCVFCRAFKERDDEKALVLYRGKHNFVLLNKYPYTPGHLMIAPYVHLDSIEKSPKESTDELADLLKVCLIILREQYNPQGFNSGMNIGHCAGAGVAGHYHMHIVPRWKGDSNFMPLVGETKVVIEDLRSTYKGLKPLFDSQGDT
jgi:ATP adenylyltransferase